MELARALIQLEDDQGETRGVNFDTHRPRRAGVAHIVGFTHAVNLSAENIKRHPDLGRDNWPNRRIHGAFLTVYAKSDNPRRSTASVLLDGGAPGLAARQRGIPLILFCHLPAVPANGEGTVLAFTIDLERVPVVFTVPTFHDPCPPPRATLNMLDALSDGRLNVIVADDEPVDFSELRITLFDSVD
jgi:hypothetical protein